MSMRITRERLGESYDYKAGGEKVRGLVGQAFATLPLTVRFFGRYVAWNCTFGSGVAALAGKIGRSRSLFVEEGYPAPIADRSVLVASYVFDAARDEFDDHATPYRDTHRCLAQATLAGAIEHTAASGHPELRERDTIEAALAEPPWLTALRGRVATGYGVGTPDDRPSIFKALGYHLGSELLADREFTMIDKVLKTRQPGLVEELGRRTLTVAGHAHSCYQWIEIHSGHGGHAEADHFDWALQGVALAFAFTPAAQHEELERTLLDGYLSFAKDHEEFFAKVLSD